MGNRLINSSLGIQNSHNWIPSSRDPHLIINSRTKQRARWEQRSYLNQEILRSYLFRKRSSQYLVDVYGILAKQQSILCNDNNYCYPKSLSPQPVEESQKYTILIQNIPYRLHDLTQITQLDCIQIIKQTVLGIKTIIDQYGWDRVNSIDFNPNLIGINDHGRCKIWINKDYFAGFSHAKPKKRRQFHGIEQSIVWPIADEIQYRRSSNLNAYFDQSQNTSYQSSKSRTLIQPLRFFQQFFTFMEQKLNYFSRPQSKRSNYFQVKNETINKHGVENYSLTNCMQFVKKLILINDSTSKYTFKINTEKRNNTEYRQSSEKKQIKNQSQYRNTIYGKNSIRSRQSKIKTSLSKDKRSLKPQLYVYGGYKSIQKQMLQKQIISSKSCKKILKNNDEYSIQVKSGTNSLQTIQTSQNKYKLKDLKRNQTEKLYGDKNRKKNYAYLREKYNIQCQS